jgi:hypothetical protein
VQGLDEVRIVRLMGLSMDRPAAYLKRVMQLVAFAVRSGATARGVRPRSIVRIDPPGAFSNSGCH